MAHGAGSSMQQGGFSIGILGGGGDDAGFLHLLDRSHPTEASCAGDDANTWRRQRTQTLIWASALWCGFTRLACRRRCFVALRLFPPPAYIQFH